MKIKFVLSLALVLSGVLVGCATHNTTNAFEYPASQTELRFRLAQTIPIDHVTSPTNVITYEVKIYVVQPNDSIANISERLHVPEREISKLNPDFNLKMIKVGQRLVVYERID
jgi:LysM repeat protein